LGGYICFFMAVASRHSSLDFRRRAMGLARGGHRQTKLRPLKENMEKTPASISKKIRQKSKNPQKSAASLRANLRRRKAATKPALPAPAKKDIE
jgi:hypothetical protein